MKRLIALLTLGALAFFPYGWLARYWPALDTVLDLLDDLLPNDVGHIVGHAMIFFVVGLIVLLAIPKLMRSPMIFFGLVLLGGLSQEILQLSYKRHPRIGDSAFDLLIDLIGAALAFLVARALLKQMKVQTLYDQAPGC